MILRTTTRIGHSQGTVELSDRVVPEHRPYERDIMKNVMMPGMAKGRHVCVEEREKRMAEDASSMEINRIEMGDTKIGFITSGVAYQYVKEVYPEASVLKLGLVYPMPEKLVKEFASKVDRLIVFEELEPFMETYIRSWGIKCEGKELFTLQGEYSANMLRAKLKGEAVPDKGADVPNRPPILCPGCPHRSTYYVLKKG